MEADASALDMPIDCCYFVDKAAAAGAVPAFPYFDSIFRHFAVVTQNWGQPPKSGQQYIVSPFVLSWNDGNYYLYAYDSEKKKFRNFRVDRMERISEPLPDKREGNDKFDKKSLTYQKSKVFGMYSGTEHIVRLRVLNSLADAVIDQFGKDIIMIPVDDKHFTIAVPVEVSPLFYAWVATFGRRMKILGPEPVAEGMKDFTRKVSSMYEE